MAAEEKRDDVCRVRETEAVCEELRVELGQHGVVLPSLGVDALSYAGEGPRPLVELGRCNAETVRALLAALRGAGR